MTFRYIPRERVLLEREYAAEQNRAESGANGSNGNGNGSGNGNGNGLNGNGGSNGYGYGLNGNGYGTSGNGYASNGIDETDGWAPEASSLFCTRMTIDGSLLDTDELLEVAFRSDWEYLREHMSQHPIFRSGRVGAFDDIIVPLRSCYRLLRYAFKWYAAQDDATFALLRNGFLKMCHELDIVDFQRCRVVDLERVFIATNTARGGVAHSTTLSGANDVDAITRWELLEAFVRVALSKYVETRKVTRVKDAVELLVHEHLSRLADLVPDPDDFRRDQLYLEETDAAFADHVLELKLAFALACHGEAGTGTSDSSRTGSTLGGGVSQGRGRTMLVSKSSKTDKDGLAFARPAVLDAASVKSTGGSDGVLSVLTMVLPEFQRLVELGFDNDVDDDEAELAFVLSKITSTDEMITNVHRRLTFVDFVEAVWRLCHQCAPQNPEKALKDFVYRSSCKTLRTQDNRETALRLALRSRLIAPGSTDAAKAAAMLDVTTPLEQVDEPAG